MSVTAKVIIRFASDTWSHHYSYTVNSLFVDSNVVGPYLKGVSILEVFLFLQVITSAQR
jgi:hypothetical protein